MVCHKIFALTAVFVIFWTATKSSPQAECMMNSLVDSVKIKIKFVLILLQVKITAML